MYLKVDVGKGFVWDIATALALSEMATSRFNMILPSLFMTSGR